MSTSRKVATKASQKPFRGTLEVSHRPGESTEDAVARCYLSPAHRTALPVLEWTPAYWQGEESSLMATARKLQADASAVVAGDLSGPEEMLVSQAQLLNTVFVELARLSKLNLFSNLDAAERLLRLGLKAQAQACRTLEALGELKNPKSIAFVKQANIAQGAQQVNNGTPSPACARGENPGIRLLEEQHEPWLDTRAPGASGGADPSLAPVVQINGSAHRARKGEDAAQCVEARSVQP